MKAAEEKVALVTGAGMGIGLACAEAFARTGYITVLADINDPKVQADKLVSEGHKEEQFTKDIPAGRLGKPEEIADAILWLCSLQATYMNGQGLIIDGGITVK